VAGPTWTAHFLEALLQGALFFGFLFGFKQFVYCCLVIFDRLIFDDDNQGRFDMFISFFSMNVFSIRGRGRV
jgi:hypothetical protein